MLGKRDRTMQRTTSMSQLGGGPTRHGANSGCCNARIDDGRRVHHDQRAFCNTQAAVLQHHIRQHGNHPQGKAQFQNMGTEEMITKNTQLNMPKNMVFNSSKSSMRERHFIEAVAQSFLDACFFCKRGLGHGRDIFMYRGDRAFCSEECRQQQILTDERWEKCSMVASSDQIKGASQNVNVVSTAGAVGKKNNENTIPSGVAGPAILA